MSEETLRSIFNIRPTHRLELEQTESDLVVKDLPYVSLDYRELDAKGITVSRYHYWETLSGAVCGGEHMDVDGNVLNRAVKSLGPSPGSRPR